MDFQAVQLTINFCPTAIYSDSARPGAGRTEFLHVVLSSVRTLGNKMYEVSLLVDISCLEIATLTETRLSPDISGGEVCLPGYALLRSYRSTGRQHGGVTLCELYSDMRKFSLSAFWNNGFCYVFNLLLVHLFYSK